MLSPGEFGETDTIFKDDNPLLGAPPNIEQPLCVSCFKTTDENLRCLECSWPVCSNTCDQMTQHREFECRIFRKAKCKYLLCTGNSNRSLVQFGYILPLRLLLCRELQPRMWKLVDEATDHPPRIRRLWSKEENGTVRFIQNRCRLDVEEQLIRKVCAAVDQFTVVYSFAKYKLRLLYSKASHIEHSCVPNTWFKIFPKNNFSVSVNATVRIQPNDPLTCCKSIILYPTHLRRRILWERHRYFCFCPRCLDKTEFGTYFSGILCKRCNKGILVADGLGTASNWSCNACNNIMSSFAARRLLTVIYNKLRKKMTYKEYESFISTYEQKLHSNHSFLAMVRMKQFRMKYTDEWYQFDDKLDDDLVAMDNYIELVDKITKNRTLDWSQCYIYRLRGNAKLKKNLNHLMERTVWRMIRKDLNQFDCLFKKMFPSDISMTPPSSLQMSDNWNTPEESFAASACFATSTPMNEVDVDNRMETETITTTVADEIIESKTNSTVNETEADVIIESDTNCALDEVKSDKVVENQTNNCSEMVPEQIEQTPRIKRSGTESEVRLIKKKRLILGLLNHEDLCNTIPNGITDHSDAGSVSNSIDSGVSSTIQLMYDSSEDKEREDSISLNSK